MLRSLTCRSDTWWSTVVLTTFSDRDWIENFRMSRPRAIPVEKRKLPSHFGFLQPQDSIALLHTCLELLDVQCVSLWSRCVQQLSMFHKSSKVNSSSVVCDPSMAEAPDVSITNGGQVAGLCPRIASNISKYLQGLLLWLVLLFLSTFFLYSPQSF